jgi:hypothetical protein
LKYVTRSTSPVTFSSFERGFMERNDSKPDSFGQRITGMTRIDSCDPLYPLAEACPALLGSYVKIA